MNSATQCEAGAPPSAAGPDGLHPRVQGTVKMWVRGNGFGFVVPDQHIAGYPPGDVFVHFTNIPEGAALAVGGRVSFEIFNRRGRAHAKAITGPGVLLGGGYNRREYVWRQGPQRDPAQPLQQSPPAERPTPPQQPSALPQGRRPALRRDVCRYWKANKCTYGSECRFLHPGLTHSYPVFVTLGFQVPAPTRHIVLVRPRVAAPQPHPAPPAEQCARQPSPPLPDELWADIAEALEGGCDGEPPGAGEEPDPLPPILCAA
eukprot:TRINITY_DN56401_c0_g1_i1.p2 TRINITY_DN56401_c0_g1~~TRINITY_DN56401_c0_g1_i1.p2  ORF type:complete len:286 (+),score=61.91 TRINITY_DN56401_c0_g1_i1:81-860(+)